MEVNAIWIGGRLDPLHAGCLMSFLECGHKVRLHTYDNVIGVPKGVELFDARKLMGENEIVRHERSKSLALASDIYRYRIMKSGLGAYVDCDVYCVRPLPDCEYLFGWETDSLLGSAVLQFPSSCDALAEMTRAASDPFFIPWWDKPLRRRYKRMRKALGVPIPVSRQKWGTIGPELVHNSVKSHGLLSKAQPIDVLYPVCYTNISLFNDAGIKIEDLCTPRTCTIHLWSSQIKEDRFRKGGILHHISKKAYFS